MKKRSTRNHILIIDGTQSRMEAGHETNAGLLYKLLLENNDPKTENLWYHPGIQGHGLWNWVTIASGLGINQTILEAYGYLCNHYEAGDKIFLFGYSRGAYAVRSLAGLISELGLLRKQHAYQRNINIAFQMYENENSTNSKTTFCEKFSHLNVEIEVIGVWDTVKALGIEYPLLSHLAPMATEFHNHNIGRRVKNGFHALALHETRTAYSPVLWSADPDHKSHIEQVWFRGAHSDIGGHVWKFPKARPLSNIPLVWMLERIEKCGIALPNNWQDRFECDPHAPAQGTMRGILRFFLFRKKRKIGKYTSEFLHSSVLEHNPNVDQNIPVQKN